MRIFIAGIMQGSHRGASLHDQDYRPRLQALLARHLPEAVVYDPLADHGNSLEYDEQRGREVFFRHAAMCRDVDVLLAFVPEASMGTAVEMWEAYHAGRTVLAISGLAHNWAVRFLSHAVYADLPALQRAFEQENLAGWLREQVAAQRATVAPKASCPAP